MLAGDASYLESTMLTRHGRWRESRRGRGEATLAGIRDLCAQRPTIYLPTHDPKSAERLHERRATIVRGHTRSATSWPPSATMVAPVM